MTSAQLRRMVKLESTLDPSDLEDMSGTQIIGMERRELGLGPTPGEKARRAKWAEHEKVRKEEEEGVSGGSEWLLLTLGLLAGAALGGRMPRRATSAGEQAEREILHAINEVVDDKEMRYAITTPITKSMPDPDPFFRSSTPSSCRYGLAPPAATENSESPDGIDGLHI